jgi:hypothetical protein
MVFIHVGSVVMLTTSETTTTWMLPVLSYTTVTGGHMAAAKMKNVSLALPTFIFSLTPRMRSTAKSSPASKIRRRIE